MTSKEWNIPIVIAAHNRPNSLNRLLRSLDKATFPCKVKLIFCIDGGGNPEVVKVAKDYNWQNGEKEVIVQDKNIGLKNNILFCGSLSRLYDGIILLEDDLYVSPVFYQYILKTVDFYEMDTRIAGISLYSHQFNEMAKLPFVPIADQSDVFFMQLPSSWGQCWTSNQWNAFYDWYEQNGEAKLLEQEGIPGNILKWPDSSWKKYFTKYMIETDRYFVYPRNSYTTNFGDIGVHFDRRYSFLQLPIELEKKEIRITHFDDSYPVYDAFCEILPDRLNRITSKLADYDYEVDLYGTKKPKYLKSKYLLTSKESSKAIFRFGREIKPHEYNIIAEINGHDICFAPTDKCYFAKGTTLFDQKKLLYYYNLRGYHINGNSKIEREETLKELLVKIKKKILRYGLSRFKLR